MLQSSSWPLIALSLALIPVLVAAAETAENEAIRSDLTTTKVGDLILTQTVTLKAPVAEVWAAFTTREGWTAWSSPAMEIDLRAGGTIRTHYGEGAAVGDPGTNTLHIVNYVPERLLTLRADLQPNWPEVMQQDAGRLMNVLTFEATGAEETTVTSFGVGYRDTAEYQKLLGFFLPANEGLYRKLIAYVETGARANPLP